jgi:hypothetical protein
MALTRNMMMCMAAINTFNSRHMNPNKATVEGLRSRGYIKAVSFKPRSKAVIKGKVVAVYSFKLTKKGDRLARHLRFLPLDLLEELAS